MSEIDTALTELAAVLEADAAAFAKGHDADDMSWLPDWFMGQLAWDALLCYRRTAAQSGFRNEAARREALTASSAALASWAALISAGMFEYNFGDSEVLTLFLFITGAPYALLTPSRQHSESLTVPM